MENMNEVKKLPVIHFDHIMCVNVCYRKDKAPVFP